MVLLHQVFAGPPQGPMRWQPLTLEKTQEESDLMKAMREVSRGAKSGNLVVLFLPTCIPSV